MALIPSDAGIRMRMQAEANLLQPVTPAHEIPSDLPDLRPGQTFSARIQEVLPDNSYKALVAGKQLTLQLPEGAKTGDLLELVVIDRSARVVIARQVESNAAAGDDAAGYEFARFTPAARLISQLLPADGESPPPAQLNRGQPLLLQAPQTPIAAQQLATTLTNAVSQSGLFYEAHQARWVSGEMPLAQLLQEPQGQRSSPAAFQQAVTELAARMASVREQASRPDTAVQTLQSSPLPKVGAGETAPVPAPTHSSAQASAPAAQIPEDLRPLVQQQLESVGTQRLLWHGEVWPNQPMELEIDWQNDRKGDGSEEESLRWGTTVSLTTPRLGRIDARLQLHPAGVHVTLATPYGASAADLRDESPKLAEALAAAGVPLLSFHVRHEDEHPARQG